MLQVNAFAKLRRHNKLPQTGITLLLPSVQSLRRFSPRALVIEAGRFLSSRTLARNVAPKSPPLSANLILGVSDADRASVTAPS